jgi:hypothetical protein
MAKYERGLGMKYSKLIDDYLCDNLSPEEIQMLEKELVNNCELREEFEQVACLLEMIDGVGQDFNWNTSNLIDFEVDMDSLAAYYNVNNVTGEIYPGQDRSRAYARLRKAAEKGTPLVNFLKKKLKGAVAAFITF